MSKLRLSIGSCLLLIPLSTAPCVWSQEVKHAPTVEQCRADQRLWFSKLEQPNGVGVADVSYRELKGWASEMGDCLNVDTALHFQYLNTQSEADAMMAVRLEDFVYLHNQWQQFLAEDAQGKGRYRSQSQ